MLVTYLAVFEFKPFLLIDQLAGLEWLRTLHEVGLNGILADEMGLGMKKKNFIFLTIFLK
jgi:SNF2 family DNA or RNA helicase